ncbi:putative NOT transcription complex subunit VIP2 [Forsythia ovata]|uniref:NOT transcription complex subunit VIP2 n=1 Tax=Forsythia ovata TaxID=205694 RepID=A0ABD1WFB3_9LAMI
MLGNSYSAAGVPLSQNQYQAGNNHFSFMQLLNDSSAHENTTFDVNDFPQLSGRPPSAGGSQGQLGLMKHNIGFTQQNQEFSIQNEDFPALTGYRAANAEFPVNVRQKEQLHDSMASLIQPQQLPQYQQFQQPQSRFINPFRDKDLKSMQASQSLPDRFGMLGLLSVIKMTNPGLTSLALGIDLTSLGLNLNSSETIHKKFASPWSDEPARGEPEYSVPECYYAKQPPPLKQSYFARFRPETLFYMFYSMPKDEAQLFAANELYARGWFYHKDLRLWFTRVKDMEPLVKTNTYERGCYHFFDPNTWQTTRKDNFVLIYEMVEKRSILPR